MRAVFLVALCCGLSTSAIAQDEAPWRTLFDGTNVDAWRGFRRPDFPETCWKVEDGMLHAIPGASGIDLVTRDVYRDFELRFSWKVAPGGNSGVRFRLRETCPAANQTGPEFQVLDPTQGTGTHGAGALYDLYAPRPHEHPPAGAWVHARIVHRGDHVEHWIETTKVLDVTIGSADWKQRIARSKYASFPEFARREQGRISLQHHGQEVWFRDIAIREFEPARPERIELFDGQSLEGWVGFHPGARTEDVWRVEGDTLICRGSPAGYLKTTLDHTNYVLHLDWRFPPGRQGNSGVLLRQIGQDMVWPRSVEAQLQSGSAGDFWNIEEFPMWVDASRSSGRHTAHVRGNENPVGEWNHYAIRVEGNYVALHVNGALVNEAFAVLETPGRICLQSEGAEIHFRDVWLEPIFHARVRDVPQRTAPRPLFESPILRRGSVELDVPLEEPEALWLVVDDGGDGNGYDWADWIAPRVRLADGSELAMTRERLSHASTGWGNVGIDRNAGGDLLRVEGKLHPHGFGVHARSTLVFDLHGLATRRLLATAGVDDGGWKQEGSRTSVRFQVYDRDPSTYVPSPIR